MSELENNLESNLNKILQEHQHESGLHVIGGRRRLVDRLVEFFEQGRKPQPPEPPSPRQQHF